MLMMIFTFIAILGAIYVARGNSLVANYLWSVSNLAFIFHNAMIGEGAMFVLFIVYEAICLFGIWNLKFNKNNNSEIK